MTRRCLVSVPYSRATTFTLSVRRPRIRFYADILQSHAAQQRRPPPPALLALAPPTPVANPTATATCSVNVKKRSLNKRPKTMSVSRPLGCKRAHARTARDGTPRARNAKWKPRWAAYSAGARARTVPLDDPYVAPCSILQFILINIITSTVSLPHARSTLYLLVHH